MQLSEEFGQSFVRLPLKKSANIKHGNALQLDWAAIVSKPNDSSDTSLYILGNPPFIGKHLRNTSQNADMELACAPLPNSGMLDYVCAWYVKATQFIESTQIKVAFVSTNSITQGEQVGALWQWLIDQGVKIHFAHRTFRWSNDARGKAAVFCVVIGFGLQDAKPKRLYDYAEPDAEPHEIIVRNINPYLVDAANVMAVSRSKPICDAPKMVYGSKPTDGGFLLLADDEKAELLSKEPAADKFIKPLISAHEFINGEKRWCVWLADAEPSEFRKLLEIMKRVEGVLIFVKTAKKLKPLASQAPHICLEKSVNPKVTMF